MARSSSGDPDILAAPAPPPASAESRAGPAPRDGRRLSDRLRAGLEIVGPDRGRLGLASVIALVTGVLETLMLYLLASIGVAIATGREIHEVTSGPVDLHGSVGATTLMAGVLVGILMALSVPLSRLLASLSARASVRLRTRLIDAYLSSTLAYR